MCERNHTIKKFGRQKINNNKKKKRFPDTVPDCAVIGVNLHEHSVTSAECCARVFLSGERSANRAENGRGRPTGCFYCREIYVRTKLGRGKCTRWKPLAAAMRRNTCASYYRRWWADAVCRVFDFPPAAYFFYLFQNSAIWAFCLYRGIIVECAPRRKMIYPPILFAVHDEAIGRRSLHKHAMKSDWW